MTTKLFFFFFLCFFLPNLLFAQLSFLNSSPKNGDSNVNVTTNLVINFSEAVSEASVNSSTIIVKSQFKGEVLGVFSGGGTSTITFDPMFDFSYGEVIYVTITNGVLSESGGNPLTKTNSYSFTIKSKFESKYYSLIEPEPYSQVLNNIIFPRDFTVVDLDQDGDMDVVYPDNDSESIEWLNNNGDESFTKINIKTNLGSGPVAVETSDLDGDGDIDILAVYNTSGEIKWFENDGSESFTGHVIDAAFTNGNLASFRDFDNDGDIDIIASSSIGFFWYENDGNQNFTKNTIENSLSGVFYFKIYDIDGDGDLDFVGTSFSNLGDGESVLAWYENDGSEIFTKNTISTSVNDVREFDIADIDNDGDIDIAVSAFVDGEFSWFENDGSEIFTKHSLSLEIGAYGVEIVDIDGDNDNDIIATTTNTSSLLFYENDGSEVFTKYVLKSDANLISSVEVADIDSDGDLDIIYSRAGSISLVQNGWVWQGNVDNNFYRGVNWNVGAGSPSQNDNILIPVTVRNPKPSGAFTVRNLVVNSSAKITLATAAYVYEGITNNGVFAINSGGSLIAPDFYTGTGVIEYTRNISTANWYLVSSPLIGQDIDAFVSESDLASGSNNNLGLAFYNNVTSAWDYHQVGASDSGDFISGVGASLKLSNSGFVVFKGVMPVEDVAISITSNNDGFNLVGNPFPSFIPANTNANNPINFLTANSSVLSESTIWLWDQSTVSYRPINQASGSFFIAPGQGFFVNASGNNVLNVTENMQTHRPDTFQKHTIPNTSISLSLVNDKRVKKTEIYLIDGSTLDFDNGYDSTVFKEEENEFNIYTQSVLTEVNKKLGIQSIPKVNLETTILPIGLNVSSDSEVAISADINYNQDGLRVFLEDKVLNTFTELHSENQVYTFTTTSSINGIGRFYLHMTTQETLAVNDFGLSDEIKVYRSSRNNLRIENTSNEYIKVNLYDILGKHLMSSFIKKSEVSTNLNLSDLNSGLYIVQIKTSSGVFSKKIVLE